ncbi:S8 family serine peptidase [Afifella sp. IM 167]|uniref:S8 family serine peptidase n=1 Tax=Afifella sp. IM 167 TaxID=2033586 RepID=UPI001CC96A5B|nr:S8 family serine peptidase [Afifella sp. IM 167]MBZ8132754.1 peptidase S8 [Afifella sp. IM 167]
MRLKPLLGLFAGLIAASPALAPSDSLAQQRGGYDQVRPPQGGGGGGHFGGGFGGGFGFTFVPPPMIYAPPPPPVYYEPAPEMRPYRPQRARPARRVSSNPKPAVRQVRTTPRATPRATSRPGPRQAARAPVRGPTRISGMPPAGESRFVADEVVVRYRPGTAETSIRDIAGWVRLEELARRDFALVDTSVYRYRVGGGRSVREAIAALEVDPRVAFVQPNYLYALQDMELAGLPRTRPAHDQSAMQYALDKLRLRTAHESVRGSQVRVAIIDSAIETEHPELDGAVTESLDALEEEGRGAADAHGTGIAGIIAARGSLEGAAPESEIVAVTAFRKDAGGNTVGSTFDIAKGFDFAREKDARIVNMSFAGPADPLLSDVVEAALDKGMILVAAAGNAGEKSPPLYPAAYEGVIAVTATGADDSAFGLANAGDYVTLAAPGVDILAPAPGGSYQVSSGTSMSAAYVSGLLALMLERRPDLSASEAVTILEEASLDLGAPGRDPRFGAGLPEADKALAAMPQLVATGR